MSVLKQLQSIVLLPGVMTLLIPGLIIYSTGALKNIWIRVFPNDIVALLIGIGLIGAGLYLVIQTIRRFNSIGRGTLAPWSPTRVLVVQGIYRHVRNPMISGVFCILLGEAVLLGSLPLFYWFVWFVLANLIYIPWLEEPGLVRRFGEEYRLYRRNVPRWIPRLHPWEGSSADQDPKLYHKG